MREYVYISTSCSGYWRKFNWKNLMRFFVTPRNKNVYPNKHANAKRDCGDDVANHLHIFWSCPKLDSFWENTWRAMQDTLGWQISRTCTTLCLGDFPDEMTGNDKYLLKIMTVAAKKAITRKWFKLTRPQ